MRQRIIINGSSAAVIGADSCLCWWVLKTFVFPASLKSLTNQQFSVCFIYIETNKTETQRKEIFTVKHFGFNVSDHKLVRNKRQTNRAGAELNTQVNKAQVKPIRQSARKQNHHQPEHNTRFKIRQEAQNKTLKLSK